MTWTFRRSFADKLRHEVSKAPPHTEVSFKLSGLELIPIRLSSNFPAKLIKARTFYVNSVCTTAANQVFLRSKIIINPLKTSI